MSRNKYIMMGALCASVFIRAASDEKKLMFGRTGRLQLSDCFKLETTRVPGPQRFYEPVIIGKLFELDIKERLLGTHTSILSSKLMRGVCGLIEGDDAELTRQAAQLISAGLQNWSMDELVGDKNGELDINSNQFIKRIIQGDVTQLGKILNTKGVLIAFQSRDDARGPLKIDAGTPIKSIFRNITISIGISAKLKDVASCHEADAPMAEQLAVLAKYAATLSVSHEAPFLTLDPKRYAEFLNQEFGE